MDFVKFSQRHANRKLNRQAVTVHLVCLECYSSSCVTLGKKSKHTSFEMVKPFLERKCTQHIPTTAANGGLSDEL